MDQVITEALDAQGVLQPGTEGWWEVWGASAQDIQAGDMVMTKFDGVIKEYLIEGTCDHIDIRDTIAPKFLITTGTIRIGCMQPIVLVRRGTKNTLAESCR